MYMQAWIGNMEKLSNGKPQVIVMLEMFSIMNKNHNQLYMGKLKRNQENLV